LEEALSFEGNTGPYVQYTYARACSVLNRAGDVADAPVQITTEEEAALVKTLCRFCERVCSAIADYEPSNITRFILDVAAAFNRFYHNCTILGADDPAVRASRVKLTEATKIVLGNAFDLICLSKTEKV
jgi:arginyl-tRNA synthetase